MNKPDIRIGDTIQITSTNNGEIISIQCQVASLEPNYAFSDGSISGYRVKTVAGNHYDVVPRNEYKIIDRVRHATPGQIAFDTYVGMDPDYFDEMSFQWDELSDEFQSYWEKVAESVLDYGPIN